MVDDMKTVKDEDDEESEEESDEEVTILPPCTHRFQIRTQPFVFVILGYSEISNLTNSEYMPPPPPPKP